MIEEEPTEVEQPKANQPVENGACEKSLPLAAQRALVEAAERREAEARSIEAEREKAKELGGREGPEPTRYGDWEKGGIVSDF